MASVVCACVFWSNQSRYCSSFLSTSLGFNVPLCCCRSLSNLRKEEIWQTASVHLDIWSVRQRPKTVWGRFLKWPLELLCKPGVARKSPGAFSYKACNFEVLFINLSVWLLAFFIIYNLLKRLKIESSCYQYLEANHDFYNNLHQIHLCTQG